MKKFFLFIIFFSLSIYANDGAYYGSGNHLIPINETNISVIKEVLRIKKISDRKVSVSVEYEFYNHKKTRNVLVGFEAPSPYGDVDGTPKSGGHPYIDKFLVNVNGKNIDFKKAIVKDKQYFKNNEIISKDVSNVIGDDFDPNSPDFFYVYYFNTRFKKGKNIVKHNYIYNLSGSVMRYYNFNYILTAANRWSNNGIDDFTLILELDPYESITIPEKFFNGTKLWKINGRISKSKNEKNALDYFTRDGKISFSKLNFHPKGELSILKNRMYVFYNIDTFNFSKHQLPFSISDSLYIKKCYDDKSYRILRNLPYARRGYVFKTDYIQKYYESQKWYEPDNSYKASLDSLTGKEKKWLEEIKKNNSF